mgnify:CR=1 FL=1
MKFKIPISVRNFLILIVVAFFVKTSILEIYVVPTGSMLDTIEINDAIIGNKFIYGLRTPNWVGIPFTRNGVYIPSFRLPAFKKIQNGDISIFESLCAAIDSIIFLASEHELNTENIVSIHVGTYAKGIEICGNRNPRTVCEAKFSLAYAVAVGLIFGQARFREFSEETLNNSNVRKVMSLIDFSINTDAEEKFPNYRSATVTVETIDGRHLGHHSPTRKGDPDNPLTDSELEAKFNELVEPVIGRSVADSLLEDCWNLEKIENIFFNQVLALKRVGGV